MCDVQLALNALLFEKSLFFSALYTSVCVGMCYVSTYFSYNFIFFSDVTSNLTKHMEDPSSSTVPKQNHHHHHHHHWRDNHNNEEVHILPGHHLGMYQLSSRSPCWSLYRGFSALLVSVGVLMLMVLPCAVGLSDVAYSYRTDGSGTFTC